MMTSAQALAIYQAGPETVVRVLLEMDARIDALIATNEKLIRVPDQRGHARQHPRRLPCPARGAGPANQTADRQRAGRAL